MTFNIHMIVGALCASFFATLTIAPGSYTIAAITLSLLSLGYIVKTYSQFTHRDIKFIAICLTCYFLIYLISMLIHGASAREIDLPSRVLLAVLVLFLVCRYPPKLNWLFVGVSVGGLISGLLALYFTFVLNTRAFYIFGYDVIQLSGICAWLSCLALVGYFHFKHYQQSKLSEVALLASAMSSLATLLSGARGGWVFTPFILIAILVIYRGYISRKVALKLSLYALTVLVISAPQFLSRSSAIFSDLEQYSNAEIVNKNTSSGHRFELWKSAIYTFSEHPLFGAGHENLDQEKEKQIMSGKVNEVASWFERAHNQFFEELQTKGLLGLIGLLIAYLGPLSFFWKHYHSPNNQHFDTQSISLLGIIHIISVIGFSLTQHYLNHHSGIIVFAFGTAIIAGTLIGHNNESKAI